MPCLRLTLPTVPLALLATAAIAQQPATDLPETIQHPQPGFYVWADTNRPSRSYREGDALSVTVVSEVDAYVHVLYRQADGKVFQIFPNSAQPDNRVKAKEKVSIPATDDLFRWRVGPPFGREFVKVLAATEPIPALSGAAMTAQRFNPVSQAQIKDVADDLSRTEADAWAEHQFELLTVPRTALPEVQSSARRFGVFFGVSQYEFHQAEGHATGGRGGLNLTYCDRDASALFELFEAVGQLHEARVYVNEQTTRRQLEETVTQWLPVVSRPGDFVLLYFSGHGGQTRDDSGDEDDGLDELLLPHDFLSLHVLDLLVKQRDAGTLDAQLAPRVQSLLDLVRGSGSVEQSADILARATGVTDDLFGHWLQRLDGRQVVVVLDICHSGGFATVEKQLRDGGPRGFDFLDGEIARLKDIGQRDSALLAACHAGQTSLELPPLRHGVMTYFLSNSLRTADGPLDVQAAHQSCAAGMQALFDSEPFKQLNERLQQAGKEPLAPHQPYYVDYLTSPTYLRP